MNLSPRQKLYRERKEAGLCTGCGSPELVEGRTKCQRCRGYQQTADGNQKKARAEKVAALVEEGRCARCGGTRDRQDRKTCAACRDASYRNNQKNYSERKKAGVCIACGIRSAKLGRVQCEECSAWNEQRRQYRANWRSKLRADVLKGYGGRCVCCGEDQAVFLDVDHVNGDGAEHRKVVRAGVNGLYAQLRRQGYPDGFQLLCRNCNWGKYINGGVCPHRSR